MANLFKNGDVVELKSTSVPMTVTQSPGDDDKKYPHEPRKDYLCVWFKGAQHLEGAFDEHALQAYTPPAKK